MGKIFVRIDDRLIHGQIVTAWCKTLSINEIIAIDNDLASNKMLQSIMTMGVPSQYNTKIVTQTEAIELLKKPIDGNRLLITRQCKNLEGVRDAIKGAQHINIGNCSIQEKAVKIPSGQGRYLYLTKEDIKALEDEHSDGIEIFSQLLPTDKVKTWDNIKKSF